MQVIDRAFVRGLMPARDPGGHKGTFGKVYLLGGSVGYTGAPVLCAGGAVHSGCGLVFLGVPETVWPIAAARCLCAMPHPLAEQDGRLSAAAETEIRRRAATCDAVAVGCGLGRSEGSDVLVRALLTLEKPLVLDADGINALAGHIDTLSCRRERITVLTPHDGELARVGGDMAAPRETAAAAFAAGASDMAGNAVAGGLGNFGILLILVRVYFMAPVVIASVRAQDSQWAAEEEEELMRRAPWVHIVGRAGWGLLFVSVGLQLLLDVA